MGKVNTLTLNCLALFEDIGVNITAEINNNNNHEYERRGSIAAIFTCIYRYCFITRHTCVTGVICCSAHLRSLLYITNI